MNERRLVVLVALLVTQLWAVLAPDVARAADGQPTVQVRSVTIADGTVQFIASVDDLRAPEPLDPSRIRLVVAGQPWPITTQGIGGSGAAVLRTSVLVVDTSGSMGARGIADARAASERYLSVVPADVAVGLVTFADAATLVVEPTTDREAVRQGLLGMRPAGNTRLYDAVQVGLDALGNGGDRALLVLSDGKDTASTATMQTTAERLAASGVAVDLVAFRTDGGQTEVLAELASRAGGRVVEAATGGELADVFATTARTIVNQVAISAPIPAGTPPGWREGVVEVAVAGGTSTAPIRIEVPTTAGAAAAAGPASISVAPIAVPGPTWVLPVIALVLFLGLFGLFGVMLSPSTWGRGSSALRSREMQRYALTGAGGAVAVPDVQPVGTASQAALGWADKAVQARGVDGSWRVALDRADIPLQPKEWLVIRVGATLAGVAFAVVALPWWLLTAPLAGLAGWLLAGSYVKIKAKRRLRKFADGLPDVLQLVAGSLRSGFSLAQSVDNAASHGQEPLAGELARALAESRLGVPLEDALERVAMRMDSTDLTWTVMAIRIAREVGGNLAEVLLATAETMRERSRIKRQVRVLSAEGRLSAYVLIGLPLGILAFMILFRRSYVSPLVTDPIGWVLTTYGVLSVLVGAWWMSRMIKLEV